MSSKVTVKLQLCARDCGDGAIGDIACSANTLRSCMVYIDVLVNEKSFDVFDSNAKLHLFDFIGHFPKSEIA